MSNGLASYRGLSAAKRSMLIAAVMFFLLSLTRVLTDGTDLTASSTVGTTLRVTIPILLAGMAGLWAERVGIVNIAIEGMMIFGTWFGGWGAWKFGPWQGLVLAVVAGAVGWWMVSSGLAVRTSVSQYRLGFHLTLACAIYAAIVWIARRMTGAAPVLAPRRIQLSAVGLMLLIVLQIYLGALVAGLDAGLSFNTWPLMDGSFIPSTERLWFETPAWRNLFENNLTVQFNHRMVAYLVWLLSIAHLVDVVRTLKGGPALDWALTLAGVITLQAGLGIVTLLYLAPLDRKSTRLNSSHT